MSCEPTQLSLWNESDFRVVAESGLLSSLGLYITNYTLIFTPAVSGTPLI